MQKELPFYLLTSLASLSEQVRYIEQATADEYLLPEELLNDAWHFCERTLGGEFASQLTAEQHAVVESLRASIKGAPKDLVDRPNIVQDPDWGAVRQSAIATLGVFGQPLPA
jgi:hypothetical protein